jgi:hypothetical protein
MTRLTTYPKIKKQYNRSSFLAFYLSVFLGVILKVPVTFRYNTKKLIKNNNNNNNPWGYTDKRQKFLALSFF